MLYLSIRDMRRKGAKKEARSKSASVGNRDNSVSAEHSEKV